MDRIGVRRWSGWIRRRLFFGFVDFFAFAFELFEFDFGKGAGSGVAAHDGVPRGGPSEDETRVKGFAAHGVIAGAETAAADDRNFRHYAVRHRINHFCAGADDAGPFGVFADHEAIDVVEENQRDAVLVAVEDEASGFLGGLGVDDAAEFDAFLIGAAGCGGYVFLLIGDDADRPATDAGVAAEQSFAVFGAVFLEFSGVDDAGEDVAHVVLLAGVVGEDGVDFFAGVKGFARCDRD